MPSESGDTGVPGSQASQETASALDEPAAKVKDYAETDGDASSHILPNGANGVEKETRTRKTSRTSEAFDQSEREEMERLLEEVRGHLGTQSLSVLGCILTVFQSCIQLVSSKEKTRTITSYLTLIGMFFGL